MSDRQLRARTLVAVGKLHDHVVIGVGACRHGDHGTFHHHARGEGVHISSIRRRRRRAASGGQ